MEVATLGLIKKTDKDKMDTFKLKEGAHPKALHKTVQFSEQVVVKEFMKEAHPSAIFRTRIITYSKSAVVRESSRSKESLSPPPEASKDGGTDEGYISKDDDYISILEDERLSDDLKEMKMTKMESLQIKFSFKKKKRRRKKRMKLKTYQRRRTILFLGDMACGKSSLVTTYCRDRFQEIYTPTILHLCQSEAKVLGRNILVSLADTSGRYDYKGIRCSAYENIDVAILCYSAGEIESLQHIRTHWLPELLESLPKCPFLLAETKRDIRDEYEDTKYDLEKDGRTECEEYKRVCREMEEKVVSRETGSKMAKEIGAHGFYSCSAKYRIGTRSLLQKATIVALKKSRRKRLLT